MSDRSNRFIDDSLDFITIKEKPKEESYKGLTPDQKKLHWENYAKTTERQELVFKKVFDSVFNEQKNQVVNNLKKTKGGEGSGNFGHEGRPGEVGGSGGGGGAPVAGVNPNKVNPSTGQSARIHSEQEEHRANSKHSRIIKESDSFISATEGRVPTLPDDKKAQAGKMLGMLKTARDNMASNDSFDKWNSILDSDTGRDQLMREGNRIMTGGKSPNRFERLFIEIFGDI